MENIKAMNDHQIGVQRIVKYNFVGYYIDNLNKCKSTFKSIDFYYHIPVNKRTKVL